MLHSKWMRSVRNTNRKGHSISPKKTSGKLLKIGIASAIAASSCCILPLLALIVGSSSLAASFSWIGQMRPYFIVISVAVLGYAWLQKLRQQPVNECGCTTKEESKFIQSKGFLVLVTAFAILMNGFPYYSKIFISKDKEQIIVDDKVHIQTGGFKIRGMSCAGCEEEVKHEINKLGGIKNTMVSYKSGSAEVSFDNTKTSLVELEKAINSTGYTVTTYNIKR